MAEFFDWRAHARGVMPAVPDQAEAVRRSMYGAQDINPENQIKAIQLSERTGVPADVVRRNLPEVQRKADTELFDWADFARRAPSTSRWVAENPNNAPLVKNDLDRMGYLERQLNYIGSQFSQGKMTTELAEIGGAAMLGRATPAQRQRQAEIDERLKRPDDYGITGFVEQIPGAVANQLPIFATTIGGKAKAGAVGGVVGAGTGAAMGAAIGAPTVVGVAPGAAAGAVTGFGIGTAAGWRYGAAIESAKMEGSLAYLDFEKLKDANGAPLDRATALGAATIVGVINGSIEGLTGLEAMIDKMPGVRQLSRKGVKQLLESPTSRQAFLRYARTVGQTMGVEGSTEFVQEMVTSAGGVLATGLQDGSLGRSPIETLGKIFTEENILKAAQAARTGAQAGGGMATVLATPQLAQDMRQVKQARENKQVFEALGEAAKGAQVTAKLPQKLQELVARITEDGGGESLYVPAEAWQTYWQDQNVDPRDVANEILGDLESYDQAVLSGADIRVPTSVYAARIAPTDHNAFFADELRVTPDGMNAREAREWVKTMDAEVKEQSPVIQDSGAAIREDIMGQLTGLGYDRPAAESYAKLYESTFTSLGQRTGMDPAELYGQYGLRIVRELPEVARKLGRVDALDSMLDRLRLGDTPSDQQIFGQSLMQFLKEKGGLVDEGGELAARDIDKTRKPFERRLIQPRGLSFDHAAEIAAEAGFLPPGSDINALLAAVDSELQGMPVFRLGGENDRALQQSQMLQNLDEALKEMGIDLNVLDNAAIKKLLAQQVVDLGAGSTTFAQSIEEYGGLHRPPGPDGGAPAHDLTGDGNVYPDDVYGPNAVRYYGAGEDRIDAQSFSILAGLKGKPNATVTIYRAVPHEPTRDERIATLEAQMRKYMARNAVPEGESAAGWYDRAHAERERLRAMLDERYADAMTIGAGDWVTINRQYAKDHGESALRGQYKIVSKKVKAGEIFTNGDSIHEWGYWPKGASEDGTTFGQDTTFGEGKRGSISFGEARQFNINLFEKANLSTVIHESGHFYLEVIGDLAEQLRAQDPSTLTDQQRLVVADYDAALKWMGVTSRDQIGVEQHERWARGFEAYTMEGKAPSAELRQVFARFRAWLVSIYRTVKGLNVTLNDNVREVMDRLVATDDQIESARLEGHAIAIFTDAASAGMSDIEFAAYVETVREANTTATERLQAKLMSELQREQKAWWKESRQDVRAEVEAETFAQPVYIALSVLRTGKLPDGSALPEGTEPFKLSRDALVESYGAEFLKRLPRPYVYSKEGGVNPDHAAEVFGFKSGSELVEALANARPRNQLIEAETDARMKELYGDMRLDGSIADEARLSVQNDKRGDLIIAELRALRRKQIEVQPFVRAAEAQGQAEQREGLEVIRGSVPPKSAVRDMARGIIAQQRVRDIKPVAYLTAARRSAKAAFDAVGKDDYQTAAFHKQRELLNHELYREASDARERVDSTVDYMQKFRRKATRERIGKAGADYLEQIDGLLDRFQFARVTLRELQRRKSLVEWIREKEASGETLNEDLEVPEWVLNEAYRVNYQDMTYEELQGVRDSVQQIEHFARLKNKLLASRDKREWEEAKTELLASVSGNIGSRGKPPLTKAGLTARGKMTKLAREFDASLIKMEQVVEWLDGGSTGPWHNYFWNGAADAQVAEYDYTKAVTVRIAKAVLNVPKPIRSRMLEHVNVPGFDQVVTRKDVIGVALNVGNASNQAKLLKGMGWNQAQVDAMIDNLTAEEWQFVQSVWDTLDSMYPDIAKLQKELTGLDPEKVVPQVVKTKFGDLPGGYYPVMYDAVLSEQGALQMASNVGGLLEPSYTRATTPRGHTKARVEGFARPFNLDIDDLPIHVAGVIKDLTHRKWMIDANKIVNDAAIRGAVRDTLGDAYVVLLNDWVKQVVNDRNASSARSMSIWRRGLEHLRFNVMVAAMGFKASTMLSQFAGSGAAMEVIGVKAFTEGLASTLAHPQSIYDFATAKSGEMRHRIITRDLDIRDQLRLLEGKTGPLARLKEFALRGIGWADMMISLPTWLGGYRQALGEGKSDEEAVRAGDRAVRLSQGAGAAKDVATIMGSREWVRLITMFYTPFSALYSRLRDVGHQTGSIKDVPQAAMRLFFVWIFASTLGELAAGRPPEGDDEDKWLKWWLKVVAVYPFMAIPGIRDFVSGATGKYGYQMSPIAQVGESAVVALSTGKKWIEGDKEFGDMFAKSLKASGYLIGLPVGQVMITGDYLHDLWTGEASPNDLGEFMHDLLYRRERQ